MGESLQCPRCSATVPANPGVCSNCGENVFQCHKCRAINYDEKDPFLCNSCGFCKYAKFEYSLTARPCCAVDPIENEVNLFVKLLIQKLIFVPRRTGRRRWPASTACWRRLTRFTAS